MTDNVKEKIEGFDKDRKEATAYFAGKSKAYRAFQSFDAEVFRSGALDKGVKQLIALAISIIARCEPCIEYHIREALHEGKKDDEILEALEVAILMGGGPSTVQARFALKALQHYMAEGAS